MKNISDFHRIDRFILLQLLTHDLVRFSKLKPEGVESNTFTYRLKRLQQKGLIGKNSDGYYFLTADGRYATDRLNLGKFTQRKIPKSICLLVLRRQSEWLLLRRHIHPLRDMVGLPMTHVRPGESIIATAEQKLEQDIGLSARLRFRGSGFLTFYRGNQLESYTQFNLLENTGQPKGALKPKPYGELETFFWQDRPDFSQPHYIPSLQAFERLLGQNQPFFSELTYHL